MSSSTLHTLICYDIIRRLPFVMGEKMPLIVGRHTSTDDNLNGVYSGQRDVPLNNVGRGEANALARTIAAQFGPDIVAILSSDLRRATYLASTLSSRLPGVPVTRTRDLREVSLGRIEQERLTWAQLTERYPGPKYQTRQEFDFTDVGGESKRQLIARGRRMMARVDAIFRQQPEPAMAYVVMISHGTFLRVLLQYYGLLSGELHPHGSFQIVLLPLRP